MVLVAGRPSLTPTAKLVFCGLSCLADDAGTVEGYVSDRMAKLSGLDRTTVYRAEVQLRRTGLIAFRQDEWSGRRRAIVAPSSSA